MVLRHGRLVPVYGARKDKVNIERGGRGYCIVILFKLGQVIGRAYKYLECNGCPRSSAATRGSTHSPTYSVICRGSLVVSLPRESMPIPNKEATGNKVEKQRGDWIVAA